MEWGKIKPLAKYPFYLIFHPFDGFWDLKHEKKGNMQGAVAILILVEICFLLKSRITGFVLMPDADTHEFNLFYQLTSVAFPFIVWCVANWCITTLLDGEGSFTDIVITSSYALFPLVLIGIPLVLLSNVITIDEAGFYYVFNTVSVLWAFFLMFVGLMTVHQFTVKRTILTFVITIFGMMVIIFVTLLFFTLIQDLVNFLVLLYNEAALRIHS